MQLTTNQERVLATLQRSDTPLSAYTILERLKSEGFKAPTQIYRALGFLAQKGLVHRLASLNAYVTCDPSCECENGVRAFAICDSCGQVHEFMVPSLDRYLGTWVTHNVFSLHSSTVELHGQCAACCKPEHCSEG